MKEVNPPVNTRGTLQEGEIHPAAKSAMMYIKSRPVKSLMVWRQAFEEHAELGSRPSQICGETLQRIMEGDNVSDRYLLGLAWTLRMLED